MKITLPPDFPIVRLPAETELAIFMINKELKSRKSVLHLEEAGYAAPTPSYDFASVILELIGFINPSENLCQWYNYLQDLYARTAEPADTYQTSQQAFNIYLDLMLIKRNMNQHITKMYPPVEIK
jgi:hypothetical protein